MKPKNQGRVRGRGESVEGGSISIAFLLLERTTDYNLSQSLMKASCVRKAPPGGGGTSSSTRLLRSVPSSP